MKIKVGARGEIVIPKKIRQQFGIEDEINLDIENGAIILKPRADTEEFFVQIALEAKYDTRKWVMGDELYEQELR